MAYATGVSAVTVGYIALYRVGYWCTGTCGTPVVFVFFPRKQPSFQQSASLGLVISWQISSDYGSGAFPPTINPMKWEPRTPLSEGPDMTGGVGEGRTWRADMGRDGHAWHSWPIVLVPVDRTHWIFRGRIGSKKVWRIRGDLRYIIVFPWNTIAFPRNNIAFSRNIILFSRNTYCIPSQYFLRSLEIISNY